MHSLPIFVDLRGRPVVLLGEGEAAEAKRRLIERAGGRPIDEVEGEGREARLAFVACADDADAAAAAARLRARGLIVNVADRPALCDFTLPAIVDRDPVLVAIGTGGRSAGLAKALRQRIEALLPAGLGALAEALFAARAHIRTRWPDADGRRRAIDGGLAEGGPLDPLGNGAADAVGGWLAAGHAEAADRIVTIRLRSADPDDLTLGEARLLGQADRLYHRPDAPPAILARARADAARHACAAPPAAPGPGLSIDLGFA
ncbi:precorrin-2 dehydrogenase/sirohydrochlorin ferrochelatase family protein [Rhizorhabdus wittichii]